MSVHPILIYAKCYVQTWKVDIVVHAGQAMYFILMEETAQVIS